MTEITRGSAVSATSQTILNATNDAVLATAQIGATDGVTVGASNGSFWDDWSTLTVQGNISRPAPLPPPPPPPPPTVVIPTPIPVQPDPVPVQPDPIGPATTSITSIFRFFETHDGSHFFTNSASERDTIIASRPDLVFEGVGMSGYDKPSADGSTASVFRFFDASNGSHLFISDKGEQQNILNTRPDLKLEGTAFYADTTQKAGDNAVYRFFNTDDGSHFFTSNAGEAASIGAASKNLVAEGIAFYTPT